jgi:short-subunit dehydrogenase
MKNISGKRALITGASSGLGVEFASLLAERKVNLVLAARRQEPMEKLASQLRSKHGIEILVVPIDPSLPDAAGRLKGHLDEHSISVDILVNNAGSGHFGDFLDTPIESSAETIRLNIGTVTELTYLFGRDMAERRSGHILLIGSVLSFQAVPTYAVYAAAKAYTLSFGEALHNELRPHGVVVTTLCPGRTTTSFDAVAGAKPSPFLQKLTMKARPVVEIGIKALLAGRAFAIPGLSNKLMALSTRLTPRSMQRDSIQKMLAS